jgi:hypothetical protein
MVLIGVGPVWSYFTEVLPGLTAGYRTEPTNISLWTLGPRLLEELSPTASTNLSTTDAFLLGAIAPATVAVAIAVWMGARPDLLSALGVVTCAVILLNPISWDYYIVLALIPILLVVAWLRANCFPVRQTLVASCVALALFWGEGTWQAVSTVAGQPLLTLGPSLAVTVLMLLLASLGHGSRVDRGRANSAGRRATAIDSRDVNESPSLAPFQHHRSV